MPVAALLLALGAAALHASWNVLVARADDAEAAAACVLLASVVLFAPTSSTSSAGNFGLVSAIAGKSHAGGTGAERRHGV